MSKDYVEWKCEECGKFPDRLNRVRGSPIIYLCDDCMMDEEPHLFVEDDIMNSPEAIKKQLEEKEE